jgi:hypothetical protein
LGTIIHETLKSLYDPFVGRFISDRHSKLLQKIDAEVLKQFKWFIKKEKLRRSKFIAFEVRNKEMYPFLKVELESIKAGDAIKFWLWNKLLNVL